MTKILDDSEIKIEPLFKGSLNNEISSRGKIARNYLIGEIDGSYYFQLSGYSPNGVLLKHEKSTGKNTLWKEIVSKSGNNLNAAFFISGEYIIKVSLKPASFEIIDKNFKKLHTHNFGSGVSIKSIKDGNVGFCIVTDEKLYTNPFSKHTGYVYNFKNSGTEVKLQSSNFDLGFGMEKESIFKSLAKINEGLTIFPEISEENLVFHIVENNGTIKDKISMDISKEPEELKNRIMNYLERTREDFYKTNSSDYELDKNGNINRLSIKLSGNTDMLFSVKNSKLIEINSKESLLKMGYENLDSNNSLQVKNGEILLISNKDNSFQTYSLKDFFPEINNIGNDGFLIKTKNGEITFLSLADKEKQIINPDEYIIQEKFSELNIKYGLVQVDSINAEKGLVTYEGKTFSSKLIKKHLKDLEIKKIVDRQKSLKIKF